jgi:hypothetical protein
LFPLIEISMSTFLKSVGAVLIAVFVTAAWSVEPGSDRRYQSVFVSKVVIEADMDRNSPDEVKYYTDLEAETTALLTKLFQGEGFAIADMPEPANDRLLVVNTKAIFNAGNRALRWVGGIAGAGKASADVTIDAVEPVSGKVITSKNAQDTMRMGGFGGSASGLLNGVIDTAWNYLITDIYEIK